MLTPGSPVGRYRIRRQIGHGVTGAVYEAEDPRLQRRVAIRLFAGPPDADGAAHLEQALSARLRHPNIVVVYEVGYHESTPYIVTELLEGETLAAIIRDKRNVPLATKLRWMEELCAGAAHAHAAGVVLRDIKPSNLLIDPAGSLKIVDFGMARSVTMPASPGAVVGTAGYMPPEQVRGGGVDRRSDLFAIGAVCYELLSYTRAFPGDSAPAVLNRVLTQDPPSLQPLVPDATPELVAAIERALRKDPAERWPDADALRTVLHRVRQAIEQDDPTSALSPALPGSTTTPEAGPIGEAAGDRRSPPSRPPDRVQFTVYRPNVIPSGEWKTMLAFMHLADRPPDAPPDLPSPRERVDTIARQLLGADAPHFAPVSADGAQRVPKESEITFAPVVPGVEFEPPHCTFRWVRDLHQEEFLLRADPALEGRVAVGHMSVFLGVVLLAQVDLSIAVNDGAGQHPRVERASALPFRKIFASYSHQDEEVVRQFETFVEALGDRYVRDVRALRAGEVWDERLLALIDEADVFQLFWSRNAMASPYVRREWEHALSLNRALFVRPTYWETPLPESPADGLPPAALRRLHFHYFGVLGAPRPQAPPAAAPVPGVAAAPDGDLDREMATHAAALARETERQRSARERAESERVEEQRAAQERAEREQAEREQAERASRHAAMEASFKDARDAFERGELERARRGCELVLDIDPQHVGAGTLLEAVRQAFDDRQDLAVLIERSDPADIIATPVENTLQKGDGAPELHDADAHRVPEDAMPAPHLDPALGGPPAAPTSKPPVFRDPVAPPPSAPSRVDDDDPSAGPLPHSPAPLRSAPPRLLVVGAVLAVVTLAAFALLQWLN